MKNLPKRTSVLVAALCLGGIFGSAASAAEKPEAPSKKGAAEETKEEAQTEPADEEPESITYVVFLPAPRDNTEAAVKEWAAKGLAQDPAAAGKIKVRGSKGVYQLSVGDLRIEVEFGGEPWLEDNDKVIEESKDKRLREMLRKAQAYVCLSIEDTFANDDEARENATITLLHLLSGFAAPEDSLAIYDDSTGDFNYLNQEVLDTLASDDPATAFEIEVLPPVVLVDSDSAAMKAAIAEARRRWPEFALAFRHTGKDIGPFIVKARFSEGDDSEFMWCEVMSIKSGKVVAVLKNEPVTLKNVAVEDKVALALTDIVDWIYPNEDGDRIGGFTIEAVETGRVGKGKKHGTDQPKK